MDGANTVILAILSSSYLTALFVRQVLRASKHSDAISIENETTRATESNQDFNKKTVIIATYDLQQISHPEGPTPKYRYVTPNFELASNTAKKRLMRNISPTIGATIRSFSDENEGKESYADPHYLSAKKVGKATRVTH